ncbi:MAG: TIGR03936 family radical SAM-associated protein [Enterocloster clostridioformis]
MRYFQKAIRRADVDVCYSGDFPTPDHVLCGALGVGITSNGEYVDIEAASTKDSETMKRCLNEVMSEGFEIVSYRILPDDAANAMSIVGAGDYTLAFRPGYEPEDMDKEQWFQGLIAFLSVPASW